MSRYIDADAVFELFMPFKDALDDEKVKSAYIQTLTLIHNTPSTDIVRCKECKYREDCEQEVLLSEWCGEIEDSAHITYCSYGEREEE